MANFKTLLGVTVVAMLTLTGCSGSDSGTQSETPGSGVKWEATSFPKAAMGSPEKVIPAGTYDFTFSSLMPGAEGSPAETIKAAGRITFGPDTCALTADVDTVTGGKPGKFKIVKPIDKGIHVYSSESKQWVTDPSGISFMPLMTYAGAGLTPRADIYGSFCVLNGMALIGEKIDTVEGADRFTINEKALNQYAKANTDWYINEILKALSYAGDTREEALGLLQKQFGLEASDVDYQKSYMFSVGIDSKGVVTVTGARGEKGSNLDGGTFILKPTKSPVEAKVPAEAVPASWTEMIVNGVEVAGDLKSFFTGSAGAK